MFHTVLVVMLALAQEGVQMLDGDFTFLMAKHHQAGIELAQFGESRGASAEVKSLAAKIRVGQQADLRTLTAHARQNRPSPMAAQLDREMQRDQAGVMARLRITKSTAFDKLFLDEMINHHETALMMIRQTPFKDASLKQLGDRIAETQQREIDELKKLQ
jgi:uncharacterized protein (DUF305 family)